MVRKIFAGKILAVSFLKCRQEFNFRLCGNGAMEGFASRKGILLLCLLKEQSGSP